MKTGKYSAGEKGMMVEFVFLIVGLILTLSIVSYWNVMGSSLAEERFGDLKIHTITQIKNVMLLMQTAPAVSETCVPITGCDKISIHRDYIEIWGKGNDYFMEPSYLSSSLSSALPIYASDFRLKEGSESDLETAVIPIDDSGFVTTCGTKISPIYVCLQKQYMPTDSGKGDFIEDPPKSGIFVKSNPESTGTHELAIVINRTTGFS